ncbi:MAG: hypothetical protein ACI4BB_09285 [Coprococcus sp.]
MENIRYEKPVMHFVSLRNNKDVAESEGPCMAQAAHGQKEFYYDAPGDGWVIIKPLGENCNGKADFYYYDNPQIEGSVDIKAQTEAIDKAKAALEADKQAFTGAYLDPQPSWS